MKHGLHRGWSVLAAATIGVFMTTPGQTVGVSPFVNFFAFDLGLPREQVLILYSIGTLLGILPAPLIGRVIDRYGPRRVVVWIVIAAAAGCLAVSSARDAWTLAAGFTLLRGTAVGGLSLVSLHMINLWFDRFRGRATAIAMMGLAAGGLVIPRLADWIASSHGWRFAYAALGLAIAAVMLPVGLIFYRNRPNEYGLLPDLGHSDAASTKGSPVDSTVSQAVRTRAFWYLLSLSVIANAVGTALLLDHVRALEQAGALRTVAVGLLGVVTFAQGLSMFAAGLLTDRLGSRITGFFGLALSILAVACAMISPYFMFGWPYAVALGASIGILQVTQAAGLGEYFGTRHLAALRGTVFFVGVTGAAAGPLPFAWSPHAGYFVFLACAVSAVLLGLVSERTARRTA
jgi:MFS family permease